MFRKTDFIVQYNGEVRTKKELNKRYGDYTAPYGIGGPSEDRYMVNISVLITMQPFKGVHCH